MCGCSGFDCGCQQSRGRVSRSKSRSRYVAGQLRAEYLSPLALYQPRKDAQMLSTSTRQETRQGSLRSTTKSNDPRHGGSEPTTCYTNQVVRLDISPAAVTGPGVLDNIAQDLIVHPACSSHPQLGTDRRCKPVYLQMTASSRGRCRASAGSRLKDFARVLTVLRYSTVGLAKDSPIHHSASPDVSR